MVFFKEDRRMNVLRILSFKSSMRILLIVLIFILSSCNSVKEIAGVDDIDLSSNPLAIHKWAQWLSSTQPVTNGCSQIFLKNGDRHFQWEMEVNDAAKYPSPSIVLDVYTFKSPTNNFNITGTVEIQEKYFDFKLLRQELQLIDYWTVNEMFSIASLFDDETPGRYLCVLDISFPTLGSSESDKNFADQCISSVAITSFYYRFEPQ